MKNVLLYLLYVLFVAGCATTHTPSSVLYQEFVQYENSVSDNNIIEVAHIFFSPSLLGNNYRKNPDATSQLLFKNYMVNTHSHHEKMNGQEGCLVVNGYDEEGSPLFFSLRYVSGKTHWLIDKIHVVYVEDEKGFPNNGKCPGGYPD